MKVKLIVAIVLLAFLASCFRDITPHRAAQGRQNPKRGLR